MADWIAPSNAFTYELFKSAPSVPSELVETRAEYVLEVSIAWDGNVLHLAHLSPLRSFTVGEPRVGRKEKVDFVLPSELLGGDTLELVSVIQGVAVLNIPSLARGTLDSEELGRVSLMSPGSLPLAKGMRAQLWLGAFEVEVALVPRGRKFSSVLLDSDTLTFAQTTGLTMLSFGGLLGSLAYFVPPLGLTDDEGIQKQRLISAQHYLAALAERENQREQQPSDSANPSPSGGSGQRHAGESGSLGSTQSQSKSGRYGVQGPKDNPDPHLAKLAALRDARAFGMVGVLAAPSASSDAPTSPFGRDAALGTDDASYNGHMWGDQLGAAQGAGGLDVSGTGDGGGGPGRGVGLGPLGTVGHGNGIGDGNDFGSGHGRLKPTGHNTGVPILRSAPVSVSGRLPGEVIQRIVRQNFGRFRLCYEAGLRTNPNLEGRITVRFAIGRDGNVSNAQLGGSDLPDSQVSSCVVSAFYGLGFPKPDGGLVSVTYPIMFTPG